MVDNIDFLFETMYFYQVFGGLTHLNFVKVEAKEMMTN